MRKALKTLQTSAAYFSIFTLLILHLFDPQAMFVYAAALCVCVCSHRHVDFPVS